MSVIKSTSEKFEEMMSNVPSQPVYTPVNMMESRETKVKPLPLSDSKKKINENAEAKRIAKLESKKTMTEAAEKISDLYSMYILEGAFDKFKDMNPEKSAKIEALKTALSEAALGAKEFLA